MPEHIFIRLFLVLVTILSIVIAAIAATPFQFLIVIKQQTGNSYREILKTHSFCELFRGMWPYTATALAYATAEIIILTTFPIFNSSLENFGKVIGGTNFLIIFSAIIAAGCTITLFGVYFEMKQIARNKGDLMQSEASIASVLLPILLRNIVIQSAYFIAYAALIKFNIGLNMYEALLYCCSIPLAFLLTPLDVVATQSCGASSYRGMTARFKEILVNSGGMALFRGSFLGVVQAIIFHTVMMVCTAITALIAFFLFGEIMAGLWP